MKILLLTAYFPPEIGSASHLFYELGQGLKEKGYSITVVTGFPRYHVKENIDRYKHKLIVREVMDGINVIRVRVVLFPRNIPVFRGLDQFCTAFFLFMGSLFAGRQDCVLVYSPPLPLNLSAILISKLRRIPYIMNLQDIFPQSAIDLGVLKNRLLIKIFKYLEKMVYIKADRISVHSEGNKKYVLNQSEKINSDKISVIPNWVDINAVKPGSRDNEFSRQYNIQSKFVVSFAGIMGYSQDLDMIIETARLVKDKEDIVFLLVGDGVIKAEAEKKTIDYGLMNIMFLPMQPKEKYQQVLHSSDVCLVTLKKEVKTPVVPSKILNIMATEKPVLASMDLAGDAPKLIKEAQCGFCVEPENYRQFAERLLELYNNSALCIKLGQNGRKYAIANLDKSVCLNKYKNIVDNL